MFRAFRTCFWEVDHPLWDVFKEKNSNSYCSSEGRNRSNQKKFGYSDKKSSLWFRGFRTYFWEVDHPLCDVCNQKKLKLILIEFLDRTKKSTASRQKKFPWGLEHFVRVFGKLTTPYVMFEIKFLLNS